MLTIQPEHTLSKKSLSAIGKPHPKAQFTPTEDAKLKSIVTAVGEKNWELVSKMMVNRNPRQCMERWNKYLSPNINKDPFTPEEDLLLIRKHNEIGAKWVKISKFFTNRTDASLKNRWNVLLRRQKSINAVGLSSSPTQKNTSSGEPTKCESPSKEKVTQSKFATIEPSESNGFDIDFCNLSFDPEMQFAL